MQHVGFTVIDSEGYRPNVGIILCNPEGRLFWAKRIGQHSWQFPQGGIRRDESPEQAMFRELAEEIGLSPDHVQVIGSTRGWLRYRLPSRLIRPCSDRPACIGQKQVWFLLRMMSSEEAVRLDLSEHPEFDLWQWVDYWYPLRAVVPFKRHVYWRALHELAPLLLPVRPAAGRRQADSEPTPDLGPARPALAIKPVILPLRSTTGGRNPVITRRVVATRRTVSPETTLIAPAMDDLRPLRPAIADPQHRALRR